MSPTPTPKPAIGPVITGTPSHDLGICPGSFNVNIIITVIFTVLVTNISFNINIKPPRPPKHRTIFYKESIQKLYTAPILEFSNPWTASYMRPTVPPESWSSIRSVELRWSFPGHWLPSKDPVRAIYVSAGRAQWIETCVALRAVAGLRSFVLILGRTWFAEELGALGVFLEPLFGLGVRDRGFKGMDGDAGDEPCSSDGEDWCADLENSSSVSSVSESERIDTSPASSLLSSPSSCSSLSSLASVSKSYTLDLTPYLYIADMGTWELRLENQHYYASELDKLEKDLQVRGIDCRITAV
ncbi:uncharacterized protein N7511_010288 [Penicillium nucicola]|uniref:uncharacterized protein n=1 Tax=Penicillium nucicola TaxID=1850975 RepID=UPI0025450CB8|nr:uncharacterized protein N7511_010288 [Penicillium nucicola]KAJ5748592.1 hypothetical protein N7511_010288 [Penicillium nucicola]